ncbi:MAG: hypothetical protein KIT35_21830 [Piscinibacter sp.]|uniref:Acb2/Tad1 domain-containing protein n=1 Tax=Piscinibacter sp. TaxID=1903157 RepID=UPI00258FD472|nr:hypothetical protein [Piscinibacter sp.]MCW5666480.1 hypothetical protein [Piscinibacter sp.]
MDNQHRKIAGYRELSQAEVDLMNAVKSLGISLSVACDEVRSHLAAQAEQAARLRSSDPTAAETELDRLTAAEPGRWVSIARTHFQEGLMALTRAVAQPGSF